MRPRACVVGALLVFALAGPALAQDAACPVTSVVPQAGVAVVRLPRGFLRAGSDSVWSAGVVWRRGIDYRLDLLRGDLRLLRATAPGETVWVRACGLLAPPPLEYVRGVYRPALPAATAGTRADSLPLAASPRPSTARTLAQAPEGGALEVTGNKTLAIEFGSSQDASLRQSLDLSVSGRLAPGVELTGVLSDRDTPLSATGSTQDLQSIDRVLVELRARDGRGALGDIPVSVSRGEFARLDRRVQGVSGEWRRGDLEFRGAAAGSQGEYVRMQFNGADGRQGPYLLTGRDGEPGVSLVPGSEQVSVDGVRMARGEAADYSMDYDRARLTFSNRRPISSASRITVEYQVALTRFKRNLAQVSSEWRRGAWSWWAHGISEGDDSGRPLTGTLDNADRAALLAAGDSLAIGAGVTAGGGDYDSVRVEGRLVYAWAGPGEGAFQVRFARLGEGRGDYADSAQVGARSAYRYVGAGRGAYVVGRLLAAPESHRLGALGTRLAVGGLQLEAEGALSRLDRNTLSARDAGDDDGAAGRVRLSGEGRLWGLPGQAGASASLRAVDSRFAPFARLERAFAEEDWGLPVGTGLEHARRAEGDAWWRPSPGQELRAEMARMRTPEGFDGTRRRAEARGALGGWSLQGSVLDTRGRSEGRAFPEGGRRRALGELRWNGRFLAPTLRAESDRRDQPGDTASVHDRARSIDADLAGAPGGEWRWRLGAGVRHDEREAGRSSSAARAQTWRGEFETPVRAPFGAALSVNRRDTRDRTSGALVRQDLASARLRGEWRPAGLMGSLQVERTGEAENRRVRELRFVGAGLGAYDATGNFVGRGDHDLVLVVSPELERFARTATSARASWSFGESDAWRGSRLEGTLEEEARRRDGGRLGDVFLSPARALTDPALARGSVLQRLEAEVAPGSRAAALRLRLERRVNADRTFENFGQTTDLRNGALRWRARPTATTSAEVEGRAQWQRAGQALAAGARYERTLTERGAQAQYIWQPIAGARLAAVVDAAWSGVEGRAGQTRTLRLGPDAAWPFGRDGRAEFSLRRAFLGGPEALALLPSAEAAGAARWDATLRLDQRLHGTTTLGFDASLRERPGRRTVVNGRAEVRAFF